MNPKTRRILLLAGRIGLAAIFLAAGILKLREPWPQFAVSINTFQILPLDWLEPAARTIPWLEVLLGVGLLSGIWLRFTTVVSSLVLTLFLSVLIRSWAMGLEVDCGCFGSGEPLGPKAIARDSVMLFYSLAVTVGAFQWGGKSVTKPDPVA